jgi:CrcB protein
MRLLVQIGLVSLGSALGGLTRWGAGSLAGHWLGKSFPFGTMFINVAGSFFLGCLATYLAERLVHHDANWIKADDLRLLLAVGFAGSFTTFSTFEYEAHGLLRNGSYWLTLAYVLGSVAIGFVALRIGVWVAERWLT